MPKKKIKTFNEVPTSVTQVTSEATQFLNQVVSTRGIIKVSQNLVTTTSTHNYTTDIGTNRGAAGIISPLTTSLITTYDNTKILVELCISGECSHDVAFILERVVRTSKTFSFVTEIASGNAHFNSLYGFAIWPHDANQGSTTGQIKYKYLDSPNANKGTTVQYQIKFYSGVGNTFYLNRTVVDASSISYERTSSNVILTELSI